MFHNLIFTGEAYAWTAIFVLPLNSATNPLVYTISSLHFHTRMLSRFGLNKKDGKGSYVSKLTNSHPSNYSYYYYVPLYTSNIV